MFLLYTRISKINIVMLLIKYLKFKFCGLKLYIKNNFIDRIVNNIQFEWNLVVFFFFFWERNLTLCMLKTCNLMVKFSKFRSNIKKKFKKFLSKLICREILSYN